MTSLLPNPLAAIRTTSELRPGDFTEREAMARRLGWYQLNGAWIHPMGYAKALPSMTSLLSQKDYSEGRIVTDSYSESFPCSCGSRQLIRGYSVADVRLKWLYGAGAKCEKCSKKEMNHV